LDFKRLALSQNGRLTKLKMVGAVTFNRTTLSRMAPRKNGTIKGSQQTFSRYANCKHCSTIRLSVLELNVIILSVILLHVVAPIIP
jgi:hypothetical protein